MGQGYILHTLYWEELKRHMQRVEYLIIIGRG